MPLNIPNLDDRRFDDLVAESQARLAAAAPEYTHLAPGDPANLFIDLFAHLTEGICYRANLIPERQRRAMLNLLDLPMRSAQPARGLIAIDAKKPGQLPRLLPSGTIVSGAKVRFSTDGELQALPLQATAMVKQPVSDSELQEAGITREQLASLHGAQVTPFRPQVVEMPGSGVAFADTLDNSVYLVLSVPGDKPTDLDAQRALVSGQTVCVGVTPRDHVDAEVARELAPRRLIVECVHVDGTRIVRTPLTVFADSSNGARQAGILRVRLPQAAHMVPPPSDDPRFAGVGDAPPEPPVEIPGNRVVCYLRVSCPDDDIALGYISINSAEIRSQVWAEPRIIAVGDGRPGQSYALGQQFIDRSTLVVEVHDGTWQTWTVVEHLTASGPDALVCLLDEEAGFIRFGDGLRGRRPAAGQRIRVHYRYGGGADGNLPAGAIDALADGDAVFRVRHELPTTGGLAVESVGAAEGRLGAFIRHRERAVSAQDFQDLALGHPSGRVARCEVVPGMIPDPGPAMVRTGIPGALSVFVLPPALPAIAGRPRVTAGLLREVHQYLSQRTMIGTELYVLSPDWQPLAVSISCAVRDPSQEATTIAAIEKAILEYLWSLAPHGPTAQGWPLGVAVDPAELATVAARVDNVLKINQVRLGAPNTEGQWQLLAAGNELSVAAYALPDLRGVVVSTDPDAELNLPGNLDQTLGADTLAVPVPVIPTCGCS